MAPSADQRAVTSSFNVQQVGSDGINFSSLQEKKIRYCYRIVLGLGYRNCVA